MGAFPMKEEDGRTAEPADVDPVRATRTHGGPRTAPARRTLHSSPKSASSTIVTSAETTIEPRQPRRLEKNRNIVGSVAGPWRQEAGSPWDGVAGGFSRNASPHRVAGRG